MSWNLLARFIDSEHFNKDPSLTVAYLARYAEHVGIHYVLCSKLRRFSYEEIEFFIPQLCHLIISIDNESMALEEFIIDLCEESVNGALLTFWLFQTYLYDLSATPASNQFQTCRRVYNRVQHIVFGGGETTRERIKENVLPVTVLSSLVIGSFGMPMLSRHAGPLAVAQARRPRPVEETAQEATTPTPPPKLTRSNTIGSPTPGRKERPGSSDSREPQRRKSKRPAALNTNGAPNSRTHPNTPRSDGLRRASYRHSLAVTQSNEGLTSTMSLPEQRKARAQAATVGGLPSAADVLGRPSEGPRRHSYGPKPSPATVSPNHQIELLRQNYFRNEMQFLTALEGISSRLVAVPKPARLSALRAELALIAQDLPAEVDIPLICPPSLAEGTASQSKHHRLVRLNPAEATSLNSAEKVPYLLMLEVLRDDFDFDPKSEQNEQLLAKLLSEKGRPKRRLFDITDSAREASLQAPTDPATSDSVLEPANGDLSSPALLQDADDGLPTRSGSPLVRPQHGANRELPRLSSGVSTMSTTSIQTPRTSDVPLSRSSSPGLRSTSYAKPQGANQADVSALADHMRAASQMLAQLELSTAKRPKTEVAAIKAKIIASMQSLEEQSFLADEGLQEPSFDTIMAKAGEEAAHTDPEGLEDGTEEEPTDPKLNTGRGADRMENDAKTGGIQRKGDRDDPSAATFGEAWEEKKERIRRSSPYGWAKNWDLISVIVKTGADLRQEAFACQLIAVCAKIWAEQQTRVWIKPMQILVTGDSSGLIETMTNAVSLHSLKRSLTLATVAAGSNPKKRIATLRDHFTKTFGPAESAPYARATANFARSLAAYSIVSYILQLKDRHNGNILIDAEGHMIHIDFGFMLSNSPGNMGFEAAPFKLTAEYVELLGGVDGAAFALFKECMKDAFQALRGEAERIVTLVELMGRESSMACYGGGVVNVMAALRARFVLERSKEGARDWVEELVGKSVGSYYTRLYDTFQYRTQGIY